MNENLRFRQEVLTRSASDREFQKTIWTACSREILYWINTFAWTYDPRKISDGMTPKIPFVTWDYQDDAFLALDEAIGESDVLIEKSRDMGASWICLTLFTWRWLFRPMESYLMVSRKEALVDGSSDSLFAHVDFIIKGLPEWMRPTLRRNKLKLINLENGSRIEGESTTDNIGRGGRRTAMLIDEFAAFEQGGWDVLSATADTTNTRLFNSTPAGTGNAFHAQRQAGTPRLRFHWSEHPEKSLGLYENEEGKQRSPWYDRECTRRAHAVEIATQLDIDYQGSDYPYFDPDTLRSLMQEFCCPPLHQGTLHIEPGNEGRFDDDGEGFLKIWCALDEEWLPPADRDYVIGCDISQGTRASDSVLTVGDRLSGEKVAEWADNETSTVKLAEIAVALCRMFSGPGNRGAYLIWEATGPGRTFGKMVVEELHYGNIYYQTQEQRLSRKVSDRPGWYSTSDGKKDLLATYRESLFSRDFINPSRKALEEAGEYVYLSSGRIEHGGSTRSPDPTNRGTGHGDRVIADALCAKIIRERREPASEPVIQVPVMSFEWRRNQRELEAEDEWL